MSVPGAPSTGPERSTSSSRPRSTRSRTPSSSSRRRAGSRIRTDSGGSGSAACLGIGVSYVDSLSRFHLDTYLSGWDLRGYGVSAKLTRLPPCLLGRDQANSLLPLLLASPFPSRTIWTSSHLTSVAPKLDLTDIQCVRTAKSYEISKRQIDLLSTELDRRLDGKGRSIVCDPAVTATEIYRPQLGVVLYQLMMLAFYMVSPPTPRPAPSLPIFFALSLTPELTSLPHHLLRPFV